MKARHAVLVALACDGHANVSRPDAAKQRVAITSKGWRTRPRSVGLSSPRCGPEPSSPTRAGNRRLERARRGARGAESSDRELGHHPQGHARELVIRARIEHGEAANGYHAGIGTWKVRARDGPVRPGRWTRAGWQRVARRRALERAPRWLPHRSVVGCTRRAARARGPPVSVARLNGAETDQVDHRIRQIRPAPQARRSRDSFDLPPAPRVGEPPDRGIGPGGVFVARERAASALIGAVTIARY
jgi:hypothetical protein